MDYINLYNGSVSADSTNGTIVSDSNKIISTVKTDGTEKYQTLAIRCETGYQTEGDTTLELTGLSKDAWAFEYNNKKGEYGAPLVISDIIKDKNVVFNLYSKSINDETPCTDTSVVINLKASIAPTK